MTVRNQNLRALATVAKGLAELAERVAFVGGATIALYVDDPAADDARVTHDVDGVIELSGYGEFAQLESRLRALGFVNDATPGGPICRWQYQGMTVDIMPTDPTILGFSNRWYREAMQHRRKYEVAPAVWISVFPSTYVLATKLEAFNERGHGDWLASHDVEDVISVLDGASAIAAELTATRGKLRDYLCEEFARVLAEPRVDELIGAHLRPDPAREDRVARIKQLLQLFLQV